MTHSDRRPPIVPCPHIVSEGTTHWCSLAQTGGERVKVLEAIARRVINGWSLTFADTDSDDTHEWGRAVLTPLGHDYESEDVTPAEREVLDQLAREIDRG